MKLSHILIAALVTTSVSIQAQSDKKCRKEKNTKTEKTSKKKKSDKNVEAKAQRSEMAQAAKNDGSGWYCPACGRG